jgi:hypothetical protein
VRIIVNWLNVETRVARAAEFARASTRARGAYISVLLYCAEQENGGRLVGAKHWDDLMWIKCCCVALRDVNAAAPLLAWDGDDLIVWRYPLDQEVTMALKKKAAKENGKQGGRPRNPVPHSQPNPKPTWIPTSDTEQKPSTDPAGVPQKKGNVTEGNEREVVGRADPHRPHTNPPPADTSADTPTQTPGHSFRDFSIEALQRSHPGIDVAKEARGALAWLRKQRGGDAQLDLRWFAEYWLVNCGPIFDPKAQANRASIPEPPGWREWVNQHHPDCAYARDGHYEHTQWADIAESSQEWISAGVQGEAA